MFDLTKYTKVYVPSISNSPKEFRIINEGTQYPILIGDIISATKDGKNHFTNPNPIVFPYTQEWYDKLKGIYPDLEPYKDDVKGLLNLLEQQIDSVACRVSSSSYEDACKNNVVVFKGSVYEANGIYFVPVNPYTLEPCKTFEDYFKVPSLDIPF